MNKKFGWLVSDGVIKGELLSLSVFVFVLPLLLSETVVDSEPPPPQALMIITDKTTVQYLGSIFIDNLKSGETAWI